MMNWFAVSVSPQHEFAVAETLSQKNVESFVPAHASRRNWSDRVKVVQVPLFSGYVLTRFEWENRVAVLRTPGVNSIVTFGGEATPIPDVEIDAVKLLVSSRLPIEPWPFLRVGQRVRVESGPLSGVEGIVVRRRDAYQVVVSISLLQRSLAATVDHGDLRPLD
jgi:transcription antitermination factor NusG